MITMPNGSINSKINRIQNIIIDKQIDACIISSSVNQFWLCGFIFDGYIYIQPEGPAILFVKRPINLKDDRAVFIRKQEQIPELLQEMKHPLPTRLMMETDSLSFNATIRLQKALKVDETVNVSTDLRNLRMIKTSEELVQIKESAEIHSKVYNKIPSLYRKGMTDIELQIEIEREMRLNGSIGIFRSFGENMDIFMGSILAGDNAQSPSPFDYALGGEGVTPILPLGANGSILKSGTTIMIDMAGNYRPYMDDMSRTFIIEQTPDIGYFAHEVSINIHNTIKAFAKPGTSCSDIYNTALEIVKENNLEAYFMGTNQQAKFIGHGVGLEINEPPVLTPRSKEKLAAGMAFALEPKFVLPGIGAVGIENTYIVNETGLETITLCNEELIVL